MSQAGPAWEWTIGEYLDRLASDEPVPGGGSVAALVGALAAALGSMVCNFTVGREKFAEQEEEVRGILAELEQRRGRLAELVQADMDAYQELRKAYRRPKLDPGRGAAIQEALRASAGVPMKVLEEVAGVARLLPPLVTKGNPNLVSDVGVAAVLAEAAARAAEVNIEINLAFLADEEFVRETRQKACALLGEVSSLALRVAGATLTRICEGAG